MSRIVAAIVPLSAEAKEVLTLPRNKRWAVPVSDLPPFLKNTIIADFPDYFEQPVVVYDPGHLHTHTCKSMKFGKARTSEVQLLGPDISPQQFELKYDTTSELLSLTNESKTEELRIATLPTQKSELAPGDTTDLTKQTTIESGCYIFRIYPYQFIRVSTPPLRVESPAAVGDAATNAPAITTENAANRTNTLTGRTSNDVQSTKTNGSKTDTASHVQRTRIAGAAASSRVGVTPPGKRKRKVQGTASDAAAVIVGNEVGNTERSSKRAQLERQDRLGPASRTALAFVSALGIAQKFLV